MSVKYYDELSTYVLNCIEGEIYDNVPYVVSDAIFDLEFRGANVMSSLIEDLLNKIRSHYDVKVSKGISYTKIGYVAFIEYGKSEGCLFIFDTEAVKGWCIYDYQVQVVAYSPNVAANLSGIIDSIGDRWDSINWRFNHWIDRSVHNEKALSVSPTVNTVLEYLDTNSPIVFKAAIGILKKLQSLTGNVYCGEYQLNSNLIRYSGISKRMDCYVVVFNTQKLSGWFVITKSGERCAAYREVRNYLPELLSLIQGDESSGVSAVLDNYLSGFSTKDRINELMRVARLTGKDTSAAEYVIYSTTLKQYKDILEDMARLIQEDLT